MVTKPVVTDPISADIKKVLRQLKLSPRLDTLPERLTLARQRHLSHAAFLELVLADEATHRDASSAARRAHAAGLDPAMRLDTWDESAAVRYDHTLWNDLTSLRFIDVANGALLLGAVGVGKTHLATALGHLMQPPRPVDRVDIEHGQQRRAEIGVRIVQHLAGEQPVERVLAAERDDDVLADLRHHPADAERAAVRQLVQGVGDLHVADDLPPPVGAVPTWPPPMLTNPFGL